MEGRKLGALQTKKVFSGDGAASTGTLLNAIKDPNVLYRKLVCWLFIYLHLMLSTETNDKI